MTYPMSGTSIIMNTDEILPIVRQGETLGVDVSYVGGKLVRDTGAYLLFNLVCNVQPISGDDMMILPEGQRLDEQLWVYTNQDEEAVEVGDLMQRDGSQYQCQSSEDWGSYSRGLMCLIDTVTDPVPEI